MVAVFVVPMWFAKRGEQAGFSALGALDRLVSPGLEPLASLAAAAAVTERVPLRTTVLLAPYRLNAVLLAKEAASVHVISGGRQTLGLGVGWREDDYEASGTPYSERGRKLDEMLLEIKRVWSGYEYGFAGGIGPDVIGDPPKLLLGGQVKRSYSRAAEHGIGWILGGGTPDQFAEGREHLERAWEDAGREGKPFGAAMGYFSLGDRAEQNARAFLDHYYAAFGEETVNAIVANTRPPTPRWAGGCGRS